jgi:hypothetical protein
VLRGSAALADYAGHVMPLRIPASTWALSGQRYASALRDGYLGGLDFKYSNDKYKFE